MTRWRFAVHCKLGIDRRTATQGCVVATAGCGGGAGRGAVRTAAAGDRLRDARLAGLDLRAAELRGVGVRRRLPVPAGPGGQREQPRRAAGAGALGEPARRARARLRAHRARADHDALRRRVQQGHHQELLRHGRARLRLPLTFHLFTHPLTCWLVSTTDGRCGSYSRRSQAKAAFGFALDMCIL